MKRTLIYAALAAALPAVAIAVIRADSGDDILWRYLGW